MDNAREIEEWWMNHAGLFQTKTPFSVPTSVTDNKENEISILTDDSAFTREKCRRLHFAHVVQICTVYVPPLPTKSFQIKN